MARRMSNPEPAGEPQSLETSNLARNIFAVLRMLA